MKWAKAGRKMAIPAAQEYDKSLHSIFDLSLTTLMLKYCVFLFKLRFAFSYKCDATSNAIKIL